jgi:hypothetical protein
VVGFAFGQGAKRDSQAVDLLVGCSAAMGSPGAQTTAYATGSRQSASLDESPSPLALKSLGHDKTRWDLDSGRETTLLRARNGTAVRGGEVTPLAPWQVKYSRPEHFPALLCSTDLRRENMEIAYMGLEAVGEVPAHHLRISAAPQGNSKRADEIEAIISEYHLYLDTQSLVLLRTKRFVFSPEAIENRSDFETLYADYRRVDGVLMPFRITNFIAGEKLWDITFRTIQLNSGVSDSDFNH